MKRLCCKAKLTFSSTREFCEHYLSTAAKVKHEELEFYDGIIQIMKEILKFYELQLFELIKNNIRRFTPEAMDF